MPWIKRISSAFSLDCTQRASQFVCHRPRHSLAFVVGDRRPRLWSLRQRPPSPRQCAGIRRDVFTDGNVRLLIIVFDVCFVYRAGFFLKMQKPRNAKLGFSDVRLVAAAVTHGDRRPRRTAAGRVREHDFRCLSILENLEKRALASEPLAVYNRGAVRETDA
jgi:hypothetical protein